MNKRRIKETKGLAQGHTGRKRQPQDLSSSSSSPESKFSKETKGLAQGHTGRKRQPQDRNSSSSSPESKFSARGALLCTCVCTEAGASADDSELSWNPPAHTNHCHLRVKPISQNYSHRQRKVERFSPTDESDEGSPNQASV